MNFMRQLVQWAVALSCVIFAIPLTVRISRRMWGISIMRRRLFARCDLETGLFWRSWTGCIIRINLDPMVSLDVLEKYPCRIKRSSAFFAQKTRGLSDFCIAAYVISRCSERRPSRTVPVGENIKLGVVISQLGVLQSQIGF